MKITCSKRDEILKKKEEWEAKRDAAFKQEQADEQSFYEAENAVTSVVKDEIMKELGKYTSLHFDVDVDRGRYRRPGLRIYIRCNETNRSDSDALAWDYLAEFNEDGEVEKQTSSWSGLKATTEAQLESLEETLEALRYLNSVDWARLLDKQLPNWKDYMTTDTTEYRNGPNFKQMLLEADIEDLIGKDILISGSASVDEKGRKYGKLYYMILRQTPSQYEVISIPGYVINDERTDIREVIEKNKGKYSYRIKKSKLFDLIDQPIEALEVM